MKAGQMEKGLFILFHNEPHLVVEREIVTPGKGSAFVRCKLRGLRTGKLLKETIKSQENLELADVNNNNCQYLYADGDFFYFMHNETYEQFQIPTTGLELKKDYLLEGEIYQVVFFESSPIDIILPPKVVLMVTESYEALRGDTATSVSKLVECDTRAKIKVPGFIKEGERILVNTETGEYVERAHTNR